MNDLQPKTIDIGVVANALGVTTEALKKHTRALFPELIQNGVKTRLNEYHITAIKSRMRPTTKVVAVNTDMEMMQKANDVMAWMASKLKIAQEENEQLQIELDESKKWHTVKKVKNLGYIKDIPARKAWSPLRKWSLANDYQVKEIEDVNYGKVKVYHADAWNAVYGVEL